MKRLYHVPAICALVFLCLGSALSQVPLPPTDLTVQNGPEGGAILRWDSSANASGYIVFKAKDDGPFWSLGATPRPAFLDWNIEPEHLYRYFVRAFNGNGPSDPGDTVRYRLGPPPPPPVAGVIRGMVTDDSTGLPVRNATISFFRGAGLWVVRTHTDSGGTYSAPLDTGSYFLRAEKFGYVPEWFDNALELVNATVVSLHQDTVNANFGLRPLPLLLPVSVSGTVTDSVSGSPLARALVVFMRPHRLFRELETETGEFGGFVAERLGIPALGIFDGVVWAGITDSSGNYTARVLPLERYIAFAVKPGFIPKFFDNKYSPFDANRIWVVHDTTGINFPLIHLPPTNNTLGGVVTDSAGLGVPSHILVVRLTGHGPHLVRYCMTDSVGNFQFNNLVAGNFLVRAIPVNNYAPAWYSASMCGAMSWRNADTVHLAGNAGIAICVKPAPQTGFSTISGQISASGNVFGAAPEGEVTVSAVSDFTGAVAGYDVTEDDGSFVIEGLPPGSYHLVADKEGYAPSSSPGVTVDGSDAYQSSGNGITVVPTEVLGVKDNVRRLPSTYQLHQNYPNPFNPSTTFKIDLPKSSVVSVAIYNLLGQKVADITNATLAAGSYSVSWNGRDGANMSVSSGVYFAKMSAVPADKSADAFVQIRKIALMK